MRPELAALLAKWAGIEATRGGIDRSASDYAARRVRELGLRSFDQYLELLTGPTCPEFQALMDSITVTYTWFFRDPPQLLAIMQLLRDTSAHGGPLQVWIAGCATGEDAYSIAIASQELGRPVEVLGTDVNSRALDRARSGRYGGFSLRELPARFKRHFTRVAADDWLLDASLRKAVRFETRNLVGPPALPATGSGWDLILCRNVLIYFVREQAHAVFETLARSLRPAGHLMVGSSEIVFSLPPELEPAYVAERLAFRRVSAQRQAQPAPAKRRSLIPSASREAWLGPLPALPANAADVAQPDDRATKQAALVGERLALRSLLDRGHALLGSGALVEALELYRAAVDMEPSDAEARTHAGVTYYLESEIDSALRELRAALLLDPDSWIATFYLALCHETVGLVDAAARAYRRVVELSERPAVKPLTLAHLKPWHADLLALARLRSGS
ncbi:MAG TPA: CheR family methyltransferase [Polyangiaceae bacterium]|nr:CheR family methyltransferase [Polyangiaceae bacterium]